MSIYKLHSTDATKRSLKYKAVLDTYLDNCFESIFDSSGLGYFKAVKRFSNNEEFDCLRYRIAEDLRKLGYTVSISEDYGKRAVCISWPKPAISKAA